MDKSGTQTDKEPFPYALICAMSAFCIFVTKVTSVPWAIAGGIVGAVGLVYVLGPDHRKMTLRERAWIYLRTGVLAICGWVLMLVIFGDLSKRFASIYFMAAFCVTLSIIGFWRAAKDGLNLPQN
jgi:hypothetical protein